MSGLHLQCQSIQESNRGLISVSPKKFRYNTKSRLRFGQPQRPELFLRDVVADIAPTQEVYHHQDDIAKYLAEYSRLF